MLVFVDESGALNPGDPNPRATLVAVCVAESLSHAINQQLYDVMRKVYPQHDPLTIELKAATYLSKRQFERSPERRAVVSEVTAILESSPVAVFAIQMSRPSAKPNWLRTVLTPHYRLLTERIELYMRQAEPAGFAKILFDERDPGADAADSRSFRTFVSSTEEGRTWRHVIDTPFFVSSAITPGIQFADLMAGAVRLYVQLEDAGAHFTSEWQRAIRRLRAVARAKTADFTMAGYTYYGMYFMPDRYYQDPPGFRPLLDIP